jgi:uncharacterized protein (TIGR02246 family)
MRCLIVLLFSAIALVADDQSDIRKILDDQTVAWNRGDIETFMQGYLNSPDITFVGKDVSRGFDGVIARYRKTYSDREKMGTLRFSEIEIKILSPGIAMILGRFNLERSAAGGGPATGRYTLIAKKTASGWKVIHDHTSS